MSTSGLRCGPGTFEEDGVCVAEEVDPTCGVGAVWRGDECVGLDVHWVHVPFAAGEAAPVSQGNHGYFSHSGFSVYAVDWWAPEGTEVAAARAGKVLEIYEDSNSGCGDASCADLANYVVIDHGDGTFGQYWHLEQGGALVEVGDLVGRGQIIGRSGNTGWSTGPHLHFQVRDPLGQSLPLYFEDQPQTGGAVFAGQSFVSGNTPEAAPADVAWSTCPGDLFSFVGITLDPGLACGRAEGGTLGQIGAHSGVDGSQVLVGTWSTVQDTWIYDCTGVQDFSGAVDLPPNQFQGYTWLIVAAADPYCYTYQGWDTSVYLPIAQ